MAEEKRNAEPELDLWYSTGKTGKNKKNERTDQLDLLWGEEKPLFDDWDETGRDEIGLIGQQPAAERGRRAASKPARLRRRTTQEVQLWNDRTEKKPARARKRQSCRDLPARRPSAARRKKGRSRQTRLQRELHSIAVYIAALLFLVLAAFAVWKFVSISKNQSTETGALSQITQLLDQKKCEKPPIEEAFLTPNPYSRPQDALPKVTQLYVHYTANPGTTARQNRDYFEGLAQTHLTSASAHFVIGYEGEIIQCIPLDEMAYAVIGENDHSISIECCYLDQDGKFTDATYQSLLKLLGWLMDEYQVDLSEVRRHYDAGGKLCPLYYAEHEDAWEQLKQDLSDYIDREKV